MTLFIASMNAVYLSGIHITKIQKELIKSRPLPTVSIMLVTLFNSLRTLLLIRTFIYCIHAIWI